MSEEKTEPIIKAGEKEIDRCPLCGCKFDQKVETNAKHQCPSEEEGGCGRFFRITVYD